MSSRSNSLVSAARSAAAAIAMGMIAGYQAVISPMIVAQFGRACRFEPSCSRFARIAIGEHGITRGSYLAIRRLLRCHPLGGRGYDPVPPASEHPIAALRR